MLFASMGLLVFSTVLIALLQQWRAIGPALVVYVAALALAQGAALGLAAGALTLLGGLAAVGILIWHARTRLGSSASGSPGQVTGLSQHARLIALALAVVGSYVLTLGLPIGGLMVLNFAAYWLLVVGVVVLLGSQAVLRLGLGLLLLPGVGALVSAALSPAADPLFLVSSGVVQVLLVVVVARVAGVAAPHQEAEA